MTIIKETAAAADREKIISETWRIFSAGTGEKRRFISLDNSFLPSNSPMGRRYIMPIQRLAPPNKRVYILSLCFGRKNTANSRKFIRQPADRAAVEGFHLCFMQIPPPLKIISLGGFFSAISTIRWAVSWQMQASRQKIP